MKDNEKSEVTFTQIEINRQIALNNVRLNEKKGEPRVIDIYRGPVAKNKKGETRKVLTYVVHENYCCFSFQPFFGDLTPNRATPLAFNEPEFENKLEHLEKMYLKFANDYIRTLHNTNKHDLN